MDIYNQRRSNPQSEIIYLQISFNTPNHILTDLQDKLLAYVERESTDYLKKASVQIDQFTNLETCVIKVYYCQKTNWQDYALYQKRKAKFYTALISCLRELNIEWVPLERPVFFSAQK